MQLVRFTKFWEDLNVRQLGECARELGYDGLDLAVRDGHAISSANVTDELPGSVRTWRELGVDCPMISSSTDLTDPDSDDAKTLFEAAAAAGVQRIKIGYFKFSPGDSFEDLWSLARRRLEGFERLSRRTGVQTMYHTHSGQCLGSNSAGMRHLLQDYDPAHVGAYVDLGHLAINGEDVQMGLAMLRDRLSAIGGKDARHFPDERPDRRARFADGFVLLGQGAAEWPEAMALLESWGFDGPITVHTEYTTDQDVIGTVGAGEYTPEAIALRARGEVEDLAYLRGLRSSE
ncbi:MAG: TIM barrel protein [Chloroflexota bacterium]|nr:TIM barrel protein [Chloroflexota bacterium]